MKVKLTMLSLMGALALNASAQTGEAPASKVAFEKGPKNNWFITLQGGVAAMAGGTNQPVSYGDRITFMPSLSVGKWHTPYFASRIKLTGGEALTFNQKESLQHENYFVGAQYNLMVDVINFFSPYKADRFFHLTPYAGIGAEYKFDSSRSLHNNLAATVSLGLQLGFRLSERVDFVLEGEALANSMTLTGYAYPTYSNIRRYSASAGLNFRLGKVGFTPVKPLDEAAIAALQGQINALRAENAELSKRPTHCPEYVAPAVQPQVNRFLADKSILFRHGRHNVSDDQLITVFDAAEFVKNHKGELVITGYAQQSESRFKDLAEKRAQAVAKVLTEKYNVPSDKITIEFKSASEAPFDSKNAWNRVVVIRSK